MTGVELREPSPVATLEQKQVLSGLHQQVAAQAEPAHRNTLFPEAAPDGDGAEGPGPSKRALRRRAAHRGDKGPRRLCVRAPTAGRVSTLQATMGQNADPQHLQLEIIYPRELGAAGGVVPARASRSDLIETGLAGAHPLRAFPYQHFGTYRGAW